MLFSSDFFQSKFGSIQTNLKGGRDFFGSAAPDSAVIGRQKAGGKQVRFLLVKSVFRPDKCSNPPPG